MKVIELMIGDWVMQDDNLQQSRVCQITGIYNNVVVDVTGEKMPLHESHIKPILLTPKILEKNEIDTVFKTRYKGFYLEYHAEAGMIMLYVYSNGSFKPTGIGFKYVHELQHALKLCGIEKTIEL